ncbi:E3 ubiquitin-protein ligase HERC6 [Phytophthora cinnamomi]|uniref:E3 ubiquitin-protein ligase HERC6 n=1 Tax=Phytophthora cinnamomi TaxID=4785 RepID=UPI00355A09C3|nr:E3 ubiquitin-protein ligase HERC6 [Phytophthora cinnamomi]
MGDVFLRALAADLQQTQRVLPPLCLFCVPQPRALLADEALTQDVLYTHFLTPAAADDAPERLGQYETLNGKQVAVLGSHIHTGRGFKDRRQVRILLSEKREIHHQEVTVLHTSRPLEGGIEVPEDPSEIDVATFRKYTAILRSFPENELVFYQLDETVSQVHKICVQEQVFERYKQTLPANLREEWEAAVEELIHAGSFDDVKEDYRLQRRHGGGVSHLLQIQQVVECYLMESLHDLIFPRVVASCEEQDRKLQQVMYRMRHYTPEDFGLRKEFQCFASEARDTLLTVVEKKTPLDMLLVFKACIDRVSDAITRNVKLRRLDFEAYQLTTDDILDQLLFVLYGKLGRRAEGLLDMVQPRQLDEDWTGWSMDMKSKIGSGDRSVVRRIAADLTLTDEDRAKLVEISNTLVHAKLEEYEEHLNNAKRVDLIRWKKFANSGATTSYLERKKSNPESNLPELLMVGPLPGTLDENMFGLMNPTLESMRIKASYLNDFSAGAVLDTIVWPTVDEPFQSVVVKWMEIDIPGASIGIVRNRDYVFLESSGILSMKNGERVGYHLFHSVNFPQTHKLPSRIRGNMSLCAIFHQEGPDRTDCRGTGIMDPGGELIRILGVMGMVQATLASVKYSYCGQMKKLAWLLEQRHAELREQGGPVVKPECVTCSKEIKSSKLNKSSFLNEK